MNQVRYDICGMPFGIRDIDFDGNGEVDLGEFFHWNADYDVQSGVPAGPRPRWIDLSFDDVVDLEDFFAFQGEVDTAVELGRGKLGYPSGRAHGHVRRGYAGAELAAELVTGAPGTYHMRHRVYQADEGRWTRRDPIGYHDGMNLYEYVGSGPETSSFLSWHHGHGVRFRLHRLVGLQRQPKHNDSPIRAEACDPS